MYKTLKRTKTAPEFLNLHSHLLYVRYSLWALINISNTIWTRPNRDDRTECGYDDIRRFFVHEYRMWYVKKVIFWRRLFPFDKGSRTFKFYLNNMWKYANCPLDDYYTQLQLFRSRYRFRLALNPIMNCAGAFLWHFASIRLVIYSKLFFLNNWRIPKSGFCQHRFCTFVVIVSTKKSKKRTIFTDCYCSIQCCS